MWSNSETCMKVGIPVGVIATVVSARPGADAVVPGDTACRNVLYTFYHIQSKKHQ
jgi:hypothetical protein